MINLWKMIIEKKVYEIIIEKYNYTNDDLSDLSINKGQIR